ncbi:hypothetical protein D3C78_1248540 [compost metagenome]
MLHGRLQRFGFDHAVEQALVQRRGRVHEIAREQQLHGLLDRQVAHQGHAGRGAEQAVADAAGGKTGRAAGHGQVALRDQLAAGRRGHALHLGDHRHRQLLQTQHQPAAPGKQRLVAGQVAVGRHFLEVMAGAERLALRSQHQHPRASVGGHGVDGRLQGAEHGAAQGVEARRIVERQGDDAARIALYPHQGGGCVGDGGRNSSHGKTR